MQNKNKCHPDRPFFSKNLCEQCYQKDYRSKNKKKAKLAHKAWRENNRSYVNFQSRIWETNNKDKVKETKRLYRKNNPGLWASYCAKRKAAILKRTPKWADLKAIKDFYKNCPVGMEVDHILPLQGQNVSGFHVLENLQYLTIKENRSKHNKIEVSNEH